MINPPAAKKYQYWTNDSRSCPPTIEDWQRRRDRASRLLVAGLGPMAVETVGEKVPARKPGDGKLKVLGDAPGDYVKVKAQ